MPAARDTSYLTTQVNTIIGQLNSIFDEIGVPANEREARETELFAALSETLHNQLRMANAEKVDKTEEAQNIVKTIKQMEASLDDQKDRGYDLDTHTLKVRYPLTDCLRDLKERYNVVSRLHRERFEQVKKLVEALESYSSHLESSFVKLRLPPTSSSTCPPNFDLSPSYVAKLDEEFTRVYDEYNRRVVLVQQCSEEIVRLWSELGIPQAQTDSLIVQHYRTSPEQLGLHQADLDRLKGRRDKLLDEKKAREKRVSDIKQNIESLWDRLGIADADRKAFLAANRGCGLRTINEFEDELARLNELKRQNLHLFVEDARVRLQELWDDLYFSEEEMLDFTPAFSDVYSDALLAAHEAEIERLSTLKEQRAPILAVVERYRSLVADREALAASASDASRLMLKPQKGEKRDPGKLLREEKMRKRIAKELPKVVADLTRTLQMYEDEYGRPFMVHGERFLDEVELAEATAAPSRSKTPTSMPPRAKTPASTPSMRPAASASKAAAPSARPRSAMKGAVSQPGAKTPNTSRPASIRQPSAPISAVTVPKPQGASPSKIPARVPLGALKHANNSPERRPIPHVASHHPPVPVFTGPSQMPGTMGPPRAPPPKMRDLLAQSQPAPPASTPYAAPEPPSTRPGSVVSARSNDSNPYVRPASPEDVYDDRERMSYVSTSILHRDRQPNQFHQALPPSTDGFHPAHGRYQEAFAPPPMQEPTIRQPMSAPLVTMSRQTSNTSSNMTTGTTATSSENWETYSDASDMEPERDSRDAYHSQIQGRIGTTNTLGMNNHVGVKRLMVPGGGLGAFAGQMPPPPRASARGHPPHDVGQTYCHHSREVSDENAHIKDMGIRVDGSDAAWSTELEETF